MEKNFKNVAFFISVALLSKSLISSCDKDNDGDYTKIKNRKIQSQ